MRGGPACRNCGFRGAPLQSKVLWPELVAQWGLTPQWEKWLDEREGSHCARCRSNLRSAQLIQATVQALNQQLGTTARYLRELARDRRVLALSIAEINSAGNLHNRLSRCPGMRYSEYGSKSPDVPSEDLTRLTYTDASFDLVVTSDTLEHIPDIDAALGEIHRVLKPGSAHVFSVPIVWDRPTRQRAVVRDGQTVHLLPPSYHGAPGDSKTDFLVFYEFGADFPDRCRAAGFKLELLRDDTNPALVTFIARKPV
jgi:SAM-dependent methyltransferase